MGKGDSHHDEVGRRKGRKPGRDAETAVRRRWHRGPYLGEVRVGVEPTLVADLVVTLGAGVEIWLAGG